LAAAAMIAPCLALTNSNPITKISNSMRILTRDSSRGVQDYLAPLSYVLYYLDFSAFSQECRDEITIALCSMMSGTVVEDVEIIQATFLYSVILLSDAKCNQEPPIKAVINRFASFKTLHPTDMINSIAFVFAYLLKYPEKIGEVCSSLQEALGPQTKEHLSMLTSPSANIWETYTIGLLYLLGSKDESYRALIPMCEEHYVKKFTARMQVYFLSCEETYGILLFLRALVSLRSTAINESVVIVCFENMKRGARPPLLSNSYLQLLLDISKFYSQYLPNIRQEESVISEMLENCKIYYPSTVDAWKGIL